VTYGELDARSNRLARFFYDRGLRPGDAVAFSIENQERFFDVVWAAQRSGLYYTPISTRLGPDETAYIVEDCGARVFITSHARRDLAEGLEGRLPAVGTRLLIDDEALEGWESYDEVVARYPARPLDTEVEGVDMLYSSGTTGRPKGVRRKFTGAPAGTPDNAVFLVRDIFGCDAGSVFLSTAPLYHGAPLILSTAIHRLGGTVVVMERFDAVAALTMVGRYQVTHSQWVPTMFVRLLKLDDPARRAADLSSHRLAIHGAGPCPVAVKEQMIEWWGPILYDYYSGTEGAGVCAITSEEWLTHKGSVGRAVLGVVHILDDEGHECAPGTTGDVFFEGGPAFEYHNDADKTASSRDHRGWTTLGDVGYLDDENYLYLSDRKAFTIVSGGVNIYPQEVEDLLALHPKVADVAVFGVPDDDLIEVVKGVVQPIDPAAAGPALERELIDYCREHLASYKCPRTIDFEPELPRHATGKLYKQLLRDRYWAGRTTTNA
jgi:long-chain acyl-CoA synthetase